MRKWYKGIFADVDVPVNIGKNTSHFIFLSAQ